MQKESEKHEKYMKRALELAQKGLGKVSPNPMVGALIVREQKIIAEGYHTGYGKAHAEVEALKAFRASGYEVEGSDIMYVSLEPCNHYGNTPPCTQAIIEAGIQTVVVAMTDPNPLVAGQGLEKLRSHGITVISGVLEEEAKDLNRVFIKNIVSKKPYCKAKWAMTLDGKMATDSGDSQWISCEASRRLVHKWRSQSDAVLIGSGTALADNPRLNLRLVEGENPKRVVIDSQARLGLTSNLVKCPDPENTILITTNLAHKTKTNALTASGIKVVQVASRDGKVDLNQAFDYLASQKIVSIFSEAGPRLSGALLEAGLIDEVAVFISPKIAGGSVHSPFSGFKIGLMDEAVQVEKIKFQMIDKDILIEAQVGR